MTKNYLKEISRKIKIYPHYSVPPCPSCGSYRTGYFVRKSKNEKNNQFIIDSALKNGELVSLTTEDGDDFFCVDCDYTWPGILEMKLTNKETLERESELRGSGALWEEIKKEREAKEEEAAPKKKRSIFKKAVEKIRSKF